MNVGLATVPSIRTVAFSLCIRNKATAAFTVDTISTARASDRKKNRATLSPVADRGAKEASGWYRTYRTPVAFDGIESESRINAPDWANDAFAHRGPKLAGITAPASPFDVTRSVARTTRSCRWNASRRVDST